MMNKKNIKTYEEVYAGYDGLYGINNISNFSQRLNPNKAFTLQGVNNFNEGDPILFNDSKRFAPHIHNNTKGIIRKILPEEKRVTFKIGLLSSIKTSGLSNDSFVPQTVSLIDSYNRPYRLEIPKLGNLIITFSADKYNNSDEDNLHSISFEVAYAISIHKAQGLEYDSVKMRRE